MDNNFEQLVKKAKEVRLSKVEKAQTRELLLRYMHHNPVRFSEQGRHQLQRSGFLSFITNNNLLYKSMAIAVVLLIAIATGGGVSFASENALPGDILYPVKVEVNENIRSAFAVSTEAKAEWKVEQAERRLQEAEKLAVQGELDGSAAATVETKFEQHTQALAKIALKLEAEGNVQAAASVHSNLEAALQAHARILGMIQASGRNGAVTSILAKVQSAAQATTQARAQAEAEVSAKASAEVRAAAEGKLQAAQNVIAEVKSFIARNKARAGAEATAEAEAKVEAAESVAAQGQARIATGAYGEAFVLFQQAIREAQEAKAFVKGGLNIDLNLGLDLTEEGPEVPENSGPSIPDEVEGESEAPASGTETEVEGDVEVEINL